MITLAATGVLVALIGIVLIALGLQMRKGNLDSLHAYHTQRVKEEDKQAFGKHMGLGIIVTGLCVIGFGGMIIASGMLNDIRIKIIGLGVFSLGLTAGMMLCVSALMKYNKGIF